MRTWYSYCLREKMAQACQTTVMDLSLKVWLEICGQLGMHSIGYLAQTCRSLKDKLYSHAPLWDCGIYYCKGSLSEETLKSLTRRGVKFVKTAVFQEADELIGTLRQFALLEELRTLYLRINADTVRCDLFSAELSPLPISCLFIALYGGKATTTCISSQLSYIFSAMHNVEELHLFLQEPLKHQLLSALLMLTPSPMGCRGWKIKDLEVRLFECNPNICSDKQFSLKTLNTTYIDLERIAVKSMGFMSLTSFWPRRCPDLIHMNICKIPPVDFDVSLWSVRSCTITCYDDSHPCPQNELTDFLIRLQNLQALNLSCFKQQTLTSDNLKTIISSCPKLVVLKILSENCLTQEEILVTITGLQDLEVLAFLHASPNSHMGGFHTLELPPATLTIAPRLRSLLGVKVHRHIDNCDLSKLKYMTGADGSIVKRSCTMPAPQTPTSAWLTVKKFSDNWYEAYGTRFFYEEHSFRNIKIMEKELDLTSDSG